MKIEAVTDIGKTRTENQDNFWSSILNIDNQEVGIICMCDGMGGLNNGGLASRIIVESVRDAILEGTDISELSKVIIQTNKTIYNISQSDSVMGSTCTVLYCKDNEWILHHIGDSRCYKITPDKKKVLLSKDHSVINQYGITKENNIKLYEKYKSKLTRCIGVKDTIEIDVYKGSYSKGDIFLLCSDGFWHSFEELYRVMDINNLRECVNSCISNGESDNITVSTLYID